MLFLTGSIPAHLGLPLDLRFPRLRRRHAYCFHRVEPSPPLVASTRFCISFVLFSGRIGTDNLGSFHVYPGRMLLAGMYFGPFLPCYVCISGTTV